MKNTLRLLLCLFFVLISACTSQEGKVEKQALALGEKKLQEVLQTEADDNIKQSAWLNKSYVEFMRDHSEVLVSEVKMHSESRATASVVMKTYPLSLRTTLAKIAGGIDESKSRRFNYGEALGLIGQQVGKAPEPVEQPLITYKFNKTSAGTWVVEF